MASTTSRKFRVEIEGIDESGYPASVTILVVIPRIPGLARKYAMEMACREAPVRYWRKITEVNI